MAQGSSDSGYRRPGGDSPERDDREREGERGRRHDNSRECGSRREHSRERERRRDRSSSPAGRRRKSNSPPSRRRERERADSPPRKRRASPTYEPLRKPSPVLKESKEPLQENKPKDKSAPAKKKSSWRDEQRRETAERHKTALGVPMRSQEGGDRDRGRQRPRRNREREENRERTENASDSKAEPEREAPVPGQRMIEVIANDRLGGKVRVKCYPDDTVGTLKKLIAGQKGTKANKIVLKKWYTIYKDHVKLSDYEIHDGMSLEMT